MVLHFVQNIKDMTGKNCTLFGTQIKKDRRLKAWSKKK